MSTRWGVLGVGQYADRHLIPAINQSADNELIAVCHYKQEKAVFFAKRNNAKRSYTSLEEMLRDPEIDVVAICTPVNQHKDQALQAIQAGKHTWIEMPLEVSIDAAKAIVEAGIKSGVKIATGFQWGFHPAHMEMRRLIGSGDVGDIDFAEAHLSLPWGGGILGGQTYWKIPERPNVEYVGARKWTENPKARGGNATVHAGIAIYLLRSILRREIEEVAAFTDASEDPEGREHKVDVLLKFEGGLFTFVHSSHECIFDDNSITIYGTKGRLRAIGTTGLGTVGTLETFKAQGPGLLVDVEKKAPKFDTVFGKHWEGERCVKRVEYVDANMYVDAIEAFAKCLEEDTEPLNSGLDGLREREIQWAIMESSRTGRVTKVPISRY